MIVILITIFLLSFIGTFFVRKFALKKNIIDRPNERSSHTVATPRGGGLAIVVTWFIGLVILFLQNQIQANLFYALLSGSILAIVSLIDDIIDLKPSVRLLAQTLSAAGGLYFLGGINLFPEIDNNLLFWFTNLITFIGIIWFINLYNFLDGIDAYASTEAILVSLGMYLIIQDSIFLLLIFSILGFLIWNWPKAKIFMGDVGSTQLGYILVILGIYFQNTQALEFVHWIILTSLFWFDATLTLFRRWRNKEQLSQAHKKHAYQRIIQAGFSHQKTVIYAIIINILIITIVFLVVSYNLQAIYLLPFILIGLAFINKLIDQKKPF